MASRIVFMSPSRRTVLQSTNSIEGKENQQEVFKVEKNDDSLVDSDSDEWRNVNKKKSSSPNYVTNSGGGILKRRHNKQNKSAGPHQPTLSVIARRNERERNRVRQVNDSFSVLRNRIPVYLYETETDEKGRQTRKKLSKVETLRLAVQYIHRLEGLLNIKPETYDSEDFEDDDFMEGIESVNDERSEMDAIDLSRDAKSSDPESSDTFDEQNISTSVFSKDSEYSFVNDFNIAVKHETEESSTDSSPLPPINSSFPLNLGYSELYVAYDSKNLSAKCK